MVARGYVTDGGEHGARPSGSAHQAVVRPPLPFVPRCIGSVARHPRRWFGVILLPLVSFAADGALATLFFVRYALRLFFGTPPPPAELAKGRAIDLSIQFLLFWLPFLVLLGWWTGKPIHMLFGALPPLAPFCGT